jgi:hypothetical protein
MNDYTKDIQDYFNQKFSDSLPTERTIKEILEGNEPPPYIIHKDPQETTLIDYDVIPGFEQNHKYQSPIEIKCLNEAKMISEHIENKIYNEILRQFGVFVDKEELIKALNYDRGQYQKGWIDGYNEATKKETKTNFDRITENEETFADWIFKSYTNVPENVPCTVENCETTDRMDCKKCFKEWLQKECEE